MITSCQKKDFGREGVTSGKACGMIAMDGMGSPLSPNTPPPRTSSTYLHFSIDLGCWIKVVLLQNQKLLKEKVGGEMEGSGGVRGGGLKIYTNIRALLTTSHQDLPVPSGAR